MICNRYLQLPGEYVIVWIGLVHRSLWIWSLVLSVTIESMMEFLKMPRRDLQVISYASENSQRS